MDTSSSGASSDHPVALKTALARARNAAVEIHLQEGSARKERARAAARIGCRPEDVRVLAPLEALQQIAVRPKVSEV